MTVGETGARRADKKEGTIAVRGTDTECAEENTKNCLWGGAMLQESSRRIEALLPVEETNLLDSCCKIYREEAITQGEDLKTKLSVEFTGPEKIV